MIRINLLPIRKKKKRDSAKLELGVIALVLIVSGVGVAIVNASMQQQIADQEKKITDNETEIKRLEKVIGEVKELETQREKLKTQLAVIEKLEKGKRGPVRVLDELSQSMPKRVWINNFRESGGSLSITGAAIDNADISEFLRSLGKSPYFSDIQLKFTQASTSEGTQIYNFEIGCRVNYQA